MRLPVKHEIIATLVGLLTLLLGLYLQAPIIFILVISLGAYVGTKLLLPAIPTDSTPNQPPTVVETEVQLARPALPVDTENLGSEIEVISKKIARELPRVKEIKVTQKTKRILELARQAAPQLASEGGYTHLRAMEKLFVQLHMLLRKYIALSSRTIVDSKLTQTRRDFQLLLYKIEDAFENYVQEGSKAPVQNFSVDLRVVEEDIDALQTER